MEYKCSICGKIFDSPRKLGGHKTSHTRNKTQYDTRRGKKRTPQQIESIKRGLALMPEDKKTNRLKAYKAFRLKEKENAPYIVQGVKLDITKAEMERYRETHPICQICGQTERKTARNGLYKGDRIQRLCVDHQHGTNHFRGLLCNDCNKKLGWFENNKNSILAYLEDSSNG